MKFTFSTWKDWRDFTEKSFVLLGKGVFRIILAVIMGLFSLIYAAYKVVEGFVRRHTVLSLATLCIVVMLCWVVTFIKMSVSSKSYEVQRDSLSYELMKVQQALDGDTLVISTKRLKQNYQKNHWEDNQ